MTNADALFGFIETSRLLLRPLVEKDAGTLLDAVDSSRLELERWIRWPARLQTLDDAGQVIASSRERRIAGTSEEFGIFLGGDDRLLGGCDIRMLNPEVPSFVVAYWLRTSETGHGYAREAVLAITRHAMDDLRALRVVITCDPENAHSIRVAQSCGYAMKARLRNEVISPRGRIRDLLVYSCIDKDDDRNTPEKRNPG